MQHPFERLPSPALTKLFWTLLAVTAGIMVVFSQVSKPLYTEAAPEGIVSFEVAGSVPQAEAILASWDGAAKTQAGFVQGLDYLFLVVYSTACAAACILAGKVLGEHRPIFNDIGRWLAWAQWAAAIFDAVENAALVVLLFGSVVSPWPEIAAVSANIKFFLLSIGILFGLAGGAAWLSKRLRPKARATL